MLSLGDYGCRELLRSIRVALYGLHEYKDAFGNKESAAKVCFRR